MNTDPTIQDVIGALDEIEQLMTSTDDEQVLLRLSSLYATVYSYKLRLMAKESKHAGS